MKFAYADPPYLGCCRYYGHDHADWGCFDDVRTHINLVVHLNVEYPDGWALSMSAPSLWDLLPHIPREGTRIASWVKPFAAYKANIRVAYTWEPVIIRGGRLRSSDGAPVTRDHLAEGITLKKGLTGAKPARFNGWVLDMLGYVEGDVVDDIFPGTNSMDGALNQRRLRV